MPTAEFMDDGGTIHEIWFETMAEMPTKPIKGPNGEPLTRIYTAPAVHMADQVIRARSVERWHPHAPRHDKKGIAIFANQKELREFQAADPRWEHDADCGSESHLNDMLAAQEANVGGHSSEGQDFHTFVDRNESKVRRLKYDYDQLKKKRNTK